LIIGGALLTLGAVFHYSYQPVVLAALMLLYPFCDKAWHAPVISRRIKTILFWLFIYACYMAAAVYLTQNIKLALYGILLVALPEEWFFRSWLLIRLNKQLQNPIHANVITSIAFALLHIPTQGVFGLATFLPSLFYGWLFQKTRCLNGVIILHAVSNLIYQQYLSNILIS
jgi:membrane protease YdiL (CAAX protease family)